MFKQVICQHFGQTYYGLISVINFLICLCYNNNLFSILTRFIWWKRFIWKRAMKLRGNCGGENIYFYVNTGVFWKYFPKKMLSQSWFFPSGKTSFWETVFWEITLLGKCHSGKLSFWETDLLGKILLGNLTSGKLSFWETSYWEKSSGKLYSGKLPLGNFLTLYMKNPFI